MSLDRFTMASRGKRKSGRSEFPPNPTQWNAERHGLHFRERFALAADEPLRPFGLQLPTVVVVATRDALAEFVDQNTLKRLLGRHRGKWSGMTIPCDDEFIVVINATHHQNRKNATLMEEFFHIIHEHKPSKVSCCPITGVVRRDYDKQIEDEAYHAAAAALVPYYSLGTMVDRGATRQEIAEHFEVSADLVGFRLKVCKLWRKCSLN